MDWAKASEATRTVASQFRTSDHSGWQRQICDRKERKPWEFQQLTVRMLTIKKRTARIAVMRAART